MLIFICLMLDNGCVLTYVYTNYEGIYICPPKNISRKWKQTQMVSNYGKRYEIEEQDACRQEKDTSNVWWQTGGGGTLAPALAQGTNRNRHEATTWWQTEDRCTLASMLAQGASRNRHGWGMHMGGRGRNWHWWAIQESRINKWAVLDEKTQTWYLTDQWAPIIHPEQPPSNLHLQWIEWEALHPTRQESPSQKKKCFYHVWLLLTNRHCPPSSNNGRSWEGRLHLIQPSNLVEAPSTTSTNSSQNQPPCQPSAVLLTHEKSSNGLLQACCLAWSLKNVHLGQSWCIALNLWIVQSGMRSRGLDSDLTGMCGHQQTKKAMRWLLAEPLMEQPEWQQKQWLVWRDLLVRGELGRKAAKGEGGARVRSEQK